jgi:hypothetical protein
LYKAESVTSQTLAELGAVARPRIAAIAVFERAVAVQGAQLERNRNRKRATREMSRKEARLRVRLLLAVANFRAHAAFLTPLLSPTLT